MTRSLRQLGASELSGKRVLVRVDYNVPLADGQVRDATRIEASYPTLDFLADHGAHPVLLSHLGRPGGRTDPRYSLLPLVDVLAEGVGRPVLFAAPADSGEAVEASLRLRDDEILLLENTRFLPGETKNDPELAHRLSELGDLFVNDAFGTTHRAHASTVGVAERLSPAVAGLLIERELLALGRLRGTPEAPFVVALGGAKISDKIDLIEGFLSRADRILIGGAMANTFLSARGEDLAGSLVEATAIDTASSMLGRAAGKIQLPVDLVVSSGPEAGLDARVVDPSGVPNGMAALDIGLRTRELYAEAVAGARTFFWNGPMGYFEREAFAGGTNALAAAAAAATSTGAFTVIGGGDSAAAIRRAGLATSVSHVSTGGGAALEYLAVGDLPGLDALEGS
jgi:3-phosphoglycerate kinase